MKIILFTHPNFMPHQSMPRFAQMIKEGMMKKGHEVEEWSPKAVFFKLSFQKNQLKKWFGYIDQYVVFPLQVKLKLLKCDKKTLFVFSDNGLGPWVSLVNKRFHVVHCHDFLAQKSALGLLPENKVGLTGKYYQKFIHWGYNQAENFICISKKTQSDLHSFLNKIPKKSVVVYNGLNQKFNTADDLLQLRKKLSQTFSIDLNEGYILHVGGNAFYKNKLGVLEIYDEWVNAFKKEIPLLLIGEQPTEKMVAFKEKSIASKSIYFLSNISNLQLQEFYQGAKVLVFPSLYEGFGWPIIEAMASGSLVLTTDEDPMKEVAGNAGFFIPKKPTDDSNLLMWKITAANELQKIMQLTAEEQNKARQKSILNSQKFSAQGFIDGIEESYKEILEQK